MNRESSILEMVAKGQRHGLVHLNAKDQSYNGREIQIQGQKVINFSSCSYLGLSLDPRLTEGATSAMLRYGHSFPTSRSYIGLGILDDLERQLEKRLDFPACRRCPALNTSCAWMVSIPGARMLPKRKTTTIIDLNPCPQRQIHSRKT